VEGRIEYRTWQDREGQTRYTTEINVRDLVMLSGRGDGGGSGGAAPGDRPERGRRPAAPAAEKAAGTGAGADESAAKADSFEDFPEALDEEDDDLPF
jgi:single-strand DNA-binding protein